MKIFVVMCWDEHGGIFNQHEPIGHFLKEEDAFDYMNEKLNELIESGDIESNELWYDQSDPEEDEADDVYFYVDTIEVR